MKKNGKKGSKLALRLVCVLMLAALLCGMGLPAAGAEEEPAVTEPVITEPVTTEQPADDAIVETAALTVENSAAGGVSLLANNEVTIYVNGTGTLSGNGSRNQSHTWTSRDTTVATVSGNNNSATVTGVSAGDVTITHRYGIREETFTVHVISAVTSTTFYPTITNAVVGYIHYTGNESIDSLEITKVNDTFTLTQDLSTANYWVFFVKPTDDSLLTGLGADGAGDLYPVEGIDGQYGDYGQINGYPNIAEIAKKAQADGYVAMFGYSRGTGSALGDKIEFNVTGQTPELTVTAVSDKATDVKPGDELTFTITITPGHVYTKDQVADTVTGVTVNTITINGNEVTCDSLKANTDGTYTTTVKYTATPEDCTEGSVTLNVEATVGYSIDMPIKDSAGNAGTVTTYTDVKQSASTECYIAPQNDVQYSYKYVPDTGIVYPDFPTCPVDGDTYYVGDSVTVQNISDTSVVDYENGGIWTFDGWYLDDQKVTEDTVSMTEKGLKFTGTWTFEPTYYNVTITKNVTGNMGDTNKLFEFTVSSNKSMTAIYSSNDADDDSINDDGKSAVVKLYDDETVTIKVPLGTTISFTENNATGYTTTYTVDESTTNGASYTISSITSNTDITVTNNKDVTIDTGISLDTLPYVLLLGGMAVLGGALLLRRKVTRA